LEEEMANLPVASSPNLVLAHPTQEEKRKIWEQTAKIWGSSISVEAYLEREEYLENIPQTRDGGVARAYL
jgi:hypothetical protein